MFGRNKKSFALYQKARVRRPNPLQRLFWDGQTRAFAGKVGTVALIETGRQSKATVYSLIFEGQSADGDLATGAFFANELETL